MLQNIIVRDLGLKKYAPIWAYQEELLQENIVIKSQNRINDFSKTTQHYLLLVEHYPVYTLGKSGKMENILMSESEMVANNIDFFKINRGGDITFHGEGQLVAYPILDLEKYYTDISKYLRNVEQVVIDLLLKYNLNAGRSTGETGVWIDADIKGKERKICAMGVRCSRWVTMHGLALNVNTDLNYFNNIIPCGIADKSVTSIEKELGYEVNFEQLKKDFLISFANIFNAEYC